MASVTIVFRKDKFNKNGEAPIHFRIIKHRKASYIASTIRIPEDKWDEKGKKVKSNHRNSKRLNSFLSNKFTEIQDTVFEYETHTKTLTRKILRDKVLGKMPVDFFEFADTVVERYKKEDKIGSFHKNQSIISKLKEFRSTVCLSFNDITHDFLLKYEQYLREVQHNKTNTIHKDMKFIRKVFNDAIREDIIAPETSPFRKYQMKLEKTQRFHLTEQELNRIERYPAQPGSRIEMHRDMFVFASYTGGIRISDILRLQWKDFDGTHLNIVIRKTLDQLSIKIPDKALEIIKKYKRTEPQKDSFIFPMLRENIDLNDPEKVHAAISSATAYINMNLKVIAVAAGIEKKLSFHISRHSFAVRALRKGISIDKVSKLLAHSAIRETQVYAKVVNEELDRAMDLFNA